MANRDRQDTGLPNAYQWAAVWIVFCVWSQCVPWILSAAGQLNGAGYLVAVLVSLPLAIWVFKNFARGPSVDLKGIRTRWFGRIRRQPVFGIWLLLLLAALIGGIIYPPTNHDGLTYRFPRVLHWFSEGQWHWIANPAEPQMNLSTHGFEWLTAFLFALTGSDRLFFLVNLVSFALLPGLLFAFLTRVRIRGRVASWWMWIFPCGYGLALQAGSIGNDLFAIPYVLAGMVFAVRARESRRISDIVLAILAAALVTGTKLSNAPLVLPIGVALIPSFSWLFRWRYAPALIGATITGLVASAAPVMIACTLYTGHFSGDPDNSKNLNVQNPVAGVVANSLQVSSRNLMPPVNPVSGWWNAHYHDFLPQSVRDLLRTDYPRFQLNWSELPQEETEGLGLGLTLLLLLSIAAAAIGFFRRSDRSFHWRLLNRKYIWIYAAIGGAVLVYLVKMGSEAAPRLMLPYYALLLVLVLIFEVNSKLTRRRWWQVGVTIAALCVLPAVLLSPNRPLVPVMSIVSVLPESVREKPSIQRISTVYATYAGRNDAMAPLRQWLPGKSTDPDRIGFVGDGRSLRTGLWRPYGTRKIETVSPEIPANQVRAAGFSAMVVDLSFLGGNDAGEWAGLRGFRISGVESVRNYAGKPPERYAVLVPSIPELTATDSAGETE